MSELMDTTMWNMRNRKIEMALDTVMLTGERVNVPEVTGRQTRKERPTK